VTYHWSVDKSFITVGTGTYYPYEASEFTPVGIVFRNIRKIDGTFK
jgi:hypothetical protein